MRNECFKYNLHIDEVINIKLNNENILLFVYVNSYNIIICM